MATDISIAGTDITYRDFEITVPTSPRDIAPSAEVTATKNASVAANDTLAITIDGTVVFEGTTRSGGTISELGGLQVEAYHDARDVFEDTVSLSLTTPTTEEVLDAAVAAADGGSNFTVSYSGTAATLDNDYNVTDRAVKRIFRDMMDRTGRVWWVDPAGTTINVQSLGGRGTWKQIDTTADRATLRRFDTGNLDTVRNAVTVVGTGDEQVRATVEDSTSISTYGRRPGNSPYNVAYVTTQSEAQAVANELIIADPQPEGTLLVGTNVGDITQPLANYEVDVLDDGKDIDADNLVVESQTIEQGRATLALGAGAGVSIEEINRRDKSRDDQNEPGSVYNSDRLASGSVDSPELVDGSVIESKLDDLAVSLQKVQDGAIDTVKITDDAIETPKIAAGAVTASEIFADTITANEIAAGTITATEVAADTLTANQINTLFLDSGELSVTDPTSGEGVEFVTTTVGGTDATVLRPISSGFSEIGQLSNRFLQGNFDETVTRGLQIDPAGVNDIDAGKGVEGNEPVIAPGAASAGYIGAVGDPNVNSSYIQEFISIYANNHVTVTPEPLSAADPRADAAVGGMERPVDVGSLLAATWGDPPEYARQSKNADGSYSQLPKGVELGHMTNWLLEALKSVERERQALADRVDDLEQRLSRLEQQS